MNIYYNLILITGLYLLLVWRDQASTASQEHLDQAEWRAMKLGVGAYTILFYQDSFWLYSLYFALLCSVIGIAEWAYGHFVRKTPTRFIKFMPNYLYWSSGHIGLAIIIYLIFFHQGPFFQQQPTTTTAPTDSNSSTENKIVMWPYYVYAASVLSVLFGLFLNKIRNINTTELLSALLLLYTLGFPLLALFTTHYWWSLLGSVIVLITLQQLIARHMVDSSGAGGIAFMMIYLLMIALGFSIFLYAILF